MVMETYLSLPGEITRGCGVPSMKAQVVAFSNGPGPQKLWWAAFKSFAGNSGNGKT